MSLKWHRVLPSKLDLHLHTPASVCFADKINENTCQRLVERAIEVGLDMVAVTDHHSVEYVDKMRRAAQGTSLVVLPGVELSTRLGEIDEVYFLAIFPEDTPQRELRDLLISLDIDSSDWGKCHYRVEKPVEFILQQIKDSNGLVISDHLDKTPQRRRAFAPLINDYGVRVFDLKDAAFSFQVKKMMPEGEQAFCFTFSDAHGVAKMGRVYSEAPLEECSWRGLKKWIEAK